MVYTVKFLTEIHEDIATFVAMVAHCGISSVNFNRGGSVLAPDPKSNCDDDVIIREVFI